MYGSSTFKNVEVISIVGDGNCLFCTIFYSLYITEDRYREICLTIMGYIAQNNIIRIVLLETKHIMDKIFKVLLIISV